MTETVIDVELRGGNWEVFSATDPEVLVCGPAGTGKSRAALEKVHYLSQRYPNARSLMIRKTFQSLKGAGLVTYNEQVLHPSDGVKFHNGNNEIPPQYQYPNGSVVLVGGLDDPLKVMSQDYDFIYAQEATDLTMTDWQALSIRKRRGAISMKNGAPFNQLLGDCNPAAPSHWLKLRCDEGKTRLITSLPENNPAYFDKNGKMTPRGALYIATLENLSGVMYRRYRLGEWAAAEGRVYDSWDDQIGIVDRFIIPDDWLRFRAIDFGYANPFTCQWWALSPRDEMFMYRELYMSGKLVEDHAEKINAYTGGEKIAFTVADHDAEGRATLNKMGIRTKPATKYIQEGIQAVEERIRPNIEGNRRLFVMRDSLIEVDQALKKAGKPTSFTEEINNYLWLSDINGAKPVKETPQGFNDHAMDCARYAVMAAKRAKKRFVAPGSLMKESLWRTQRIANGLYRT